MFKLIILCQIGANIYQNIILKILLLYPPLEHCALQKKGDTTLQKKGTFRESEGKNKMGHFFSITKCKEINYIFDYIAY